MKLQMRHIPVSYTHLDVYKRQVQQSGESLLLVILFELMKQMLILVLRFCGLALFPDFFIHFLKQAADFLYTERFYQIFGYTAGSVSYTHLDVYKRQVFKTSNKWVYYEGGDES